MDNIPSWAQDSQPEQQAAPEQVPTWASEQPNQEPEQQSAPEQGPVMEKSAWDSFKNGTYAASLGVEQGLKSIAATGAKAVASLINPGLKKYIQENYEKDANEYQNTPEVQAHPIAAFGGNLLGGVAATAGLPLGAAGAVYKATKPALGLLGGVASGVAAGSAEGAALGSLFTAPGQGEDVLNKEGAKTGAVVGGVLSSLPIAAASYASKVKQYNTAVDQTKIKYKGQEVPGAEYNAPVIARDFIKGYSTTLGNKVLDNLGSLGTGGNRADQVQGVKDSLQGLNQYLIENAAGKANATNTDLTKVIKNQIDKASRTFLEQRDNMFNPLYQQLDKEVGKIELPSNYKQQALDILEAHGQYLNKTTKQTLTSLAGETADLTPTTIKSLKNDLWNAADNLGASKASPAQEKLASQDLMNFYNQTKSLVEDKIQNNIPLLTQYKTANLFEKTRQEIFNKSAHPEFVKAIEDKANELGNVTKFINFLTNPNTSENAVRKYMGLIGQEGSDALQAKLFNKILSKNIDQSTETGIFNLGGFINDVEQTESSGQRLILQDAKDSIKGLLSVVAKPNVQAKIDANKATGLMRVAEYGVGGTALGVASATGGVTGALQAAAAVAGTIKAISAISAHSPLKRILGTLNKNINPNMSDYLTTKAADLMHRLGIVSTTTEDGSIELKHKDEIKPLSLNDDQQGIIPGYMRIPQNLKNIPKQTG